MKHPRANSTVFGQLLMRLPLSFDDLGHVEVEEAKSSHPGAKVAVLADSAKLPHLNQLRYANA